MPSVEANHSFVPVIHVATQFLTHIFDKFSEKSKIAKKTTKNPKKNAF
jgi:hypothetical protein